MLCDYTEHTMDLKMRPLNTQGEGPTPFVRVPGMPSLFRSFSKCGGFLTPNSGATLPAAFQCWLADMR